VPKWVYKAVESSTVKKAQFELMVTFPALSLAKVLRIFVLLSLAAAVTALHTTPLPLMRLSVRTLAFTPAHNLGLRGGAIELPLGLTGLETFEHVARGACILQVCAEY